MHGLRFPVRIKHILLLVFVCLLAVPLLQGQSVEEDEFKIASQPYIPQDPHAIRVQSTMVEVNVVVCDAHGKPISGLKKEDFEVYDQGKQQKISSFSAEVSNSPVVRAPQQAAEAAAAPPPPPLPIPPRFLEMYFDDENMSTGQLVYIRKAAQAFVNKNMEETDRAAVFTSSETVTQQFTSSKQQILDALAKLLSHQHGQTFGGCPIITPYQAYEIELFFNEHSDAMNLAVAEAGQCHACDGASDCLRFVESKAATVLSLQENFAQDSLGVLGDIVRYMGKMPGRRTLIMASSGFFSVPAKIQHAQDKMIDAAIHAGIVINTLDAKGLAAPFDMAEGEQLMTREGSNNAYASMLGTMEQEVSDDPLAAIAYGTGGKFFHDNNDIIGGLRQMAEVPEASYVLGFSPEVIKARGKVRRGLDRVEADAAGDRRLVVAGGLRGVEPAARGRAADHRADGRRLRADAGRVGSRSGGARHQADGETAVGDPGSGVYLFHLQPRHVPGDCSLPGGAGRREEHCAAEPEAECEPGPDPAGRFASVGEASLHRRRADSGTHILEQTVRRFRAAAHRGASR